MSATKLFIIQKDDNKSFTWADVAKGIGIELLPQPGSPIKAPLFLLQTVLHRGVPAGYVVRYLNDYRALPKTLLRLASELLLVMFCTLLQIKLFWICHNVDKETSAHHPHISILRRKMFAGVSKRIFVTDPLLVSHAKEHFPAHSHKIDGISFGQIEHDGRPDRDNEDQAIAFIEKKRQEAKAVSEKPLVLLCTGAPRKKCLHFDYLEELLSAGRKKGHRIISIVAGEFTTSTRGKSLLERYEKHPDICVFGHFTRFSHDFIRQYVDFYWRSYDDWSVPFTVYEAVTLGKPILALDSGFLPEMIKAYNLGEITPYSFDVVSTSLAKLLNFVPGKPRDVFLREHCWAVLPLKLQEIF